MGRSGTEQADYANFDFADFAQEFLRRNEAYRQEYAAIAELIQQDPTAPISREMARSWGLVFPHSPGRQCSCGTCGVACIGGTLGRPHVPGT
jgi:hypothetical protein